MTRRLLSLCLLLVFLPACSPPPVATPPSTPQAILITRSPALLGWDPKLYSCAKDFPQLAVFVEEKVLGLPGSASPTLELRFGAPTEMAENSFLLGWDDLILLANTTFPLDEISLPQLQGLFTGQLSTFQDLDPQSPATVLQVWTYPAGDETRQVFDRAVLSQLTAPPLALIAPDPPAMLEALAGGIGAVGYLPVSAFPLADAAQKSQVKILALKDKPAEFFRQPVIALLSAQPGALLNAYFQCLQNPQ